MFDIIIIGAGIVGLAIARSIGENTNKSVLVIEKETFLAVEFQVVTVK